MGDLRAALRPIVMATLVPPPEGLLDDHACLADAGLDSIALVQLIAALDVLFGISAEPEDLCAENFGSIAALAAYVERRMS